jgi:hypothetical protein
MTRCATRQELDLEISRLQPGHSAELSELDVERLFGKGDIAWGQLGSFARSYSCILIRQFCGAQLIKMRAGGPHKRHAAYDDASDIREAS